MLESHKKESGGSLVASLLTFYSDHSSSNPTKMYSLSLLKGKNNLTNFYNERGTIKTCKVPYDHKDFIVLKICFTFHREHFPRTKMTHHQTIPNLKASTFTTLAPLRAGGSLAFILENRSTSASPHRVLTTTSGNNCIS